MNLTPKQLAILQIIHDTRQANGYSPTMQELATELGVSRVTIFEHIEALIKKGALNREPNKARSLSLRDASVLPDCDPAEMMPASPLHFPLVGRIAAGYPLEKFEDNDVLDVVSLIGDPIGKRGTSFALQVEGDSMRDEGILDGDYVIVEQRSTARNGDRVVALLEDGETTLKTFFKEKNGTIRLQPANTDFEPIIVTQCEIQGVITGVLRRY
jgi:repressor LexA